MPRNGSGTYSLPAGNPVVPDTTIDASWANDTMQDLANEITNSLSRTGAGGMLAPFRVADGSVSAPGLAFLNEANSGFYRAGSGEVWWAINGVAVLQLTQNGILLGASKNLVVGGNETVSGTLAVTGAITASAGVNANNQKVTNLATPTVNADAANKVYVDDLVNPVIQYANYYLGPKSSDPLVNNSGGALTEGTTYWSTTLDQMRVYNGTNWVPMPTISSLVGQTFNGTGAQTAFTLANPTGNAINLEVFISGVRQVPTTDYSVSGATLTFVAAPPSGTANIFVRYAQLGTITDGAGSIVYTPAGTGAVATTVQTKLRESVSVKDFGAVGDGSTNDTAAIQAALSSTATDIYFPQGTYRVVDSLLDGSAVLTSAVNGRKLHGPGVLTATSQVKKLLLVSGDDTKTNINVDGNNYIGFAIFVTGSNPVVSDCNIKNLNGLTNWGGIAIRLSFFGKDGGGIVSNNTISNLQGVGDGTPSNGIGMQRAIIVESDQDCVRPVLITGNAINQVEGEEGDAIVIYCDDGSGTFFNLPAVISGNAVDTWTRRAVKIQANNVSVLGNSFSNDLPAYLSSLQRVVDIVRGGSITVSGNTFISCKYQPQIAAYYSAPEADSNFSVCNNTIIGVGSESNTYGPLILMNTYGSGVLVSGNNVLCPSYTGIAVQSSNNTESVITSNTIKTANGNWWNTTGSTAVRFAGNVLGNSNLGEYQAYYEETSNEYVVDVSAGRALTLYQRDPTLNSGEIVAKIQCRQNDAQDPAAVNSYIAFVAEGTTGLLGVAIYTDNGTSLAERIRISAAGHLKPAVDNSQTLGTTTERWSYVHAYNVRTHGVTVATLPAAATAGAGTRAFVTDANATTFASVVAGGGANGVPVYSDGTNWRIG